VAARPLRAIILTTGELFGGAERQNLTLMQGLRDLAVPTELALFYDGELAARARSAGFTVHLLKRSRPLDPSCVSLIRELIRERPDHVISVHGYLGSIYLALAMSRAVAAVKTEHGFVEHAFVPWRERIRSSAYRMAENWATRRLRAHVVYVTEDLRRRCEPAHHRLRRTVIFNGVEHLDRDAIPRPAEYTEGSFHLALVGRIEPVKGIDAAIRALADPAAPPNAQLHVIGSGPQRAQLECLTKELRLEDRVAFHGFRNNSYDYVAHADALLMPSLHEGLPYTALEAMALRTPIIASRVGGLAEALEHGRTALLIPPKQPGKLAGAIAELASSPALADRLRNEAWEDVTKRFSARAMAIQYVSVFEAALAQRRRSGA
jgi:glycosyltransferase involved in cell wall biosynthesis